MAKNPPANAGDPGSIPGSGKSPGGGNDNPLQCSWLGNSMDRGAWWATVYGVAKSRTHLEQLNYNMKASSVLWDSNLPETPDSDLQARHLASKGDHSLYSQFRHRGLKFAAK